MIAYVSLFLFRLLFLAYRNLNLSAVTNAISPIHNANVSPVCSLARPICFLVNLRTYVECN